MKSLPFAFLFLLTCVATASAQTPGGYNCTETWLPHTNNCNDHLWDGYCCEKSCHRNPACSHNSNCPTCNAGTETN
jgi:hypothetical protein